jgi:hypothetical protein
MRRSRPGLGRSVTEKKKLEKLLVFKTRFHGVEEEKRGRRLDKYQPKCHFLTNAVRNVLQLNPGLRDGKSHGT